MRRPAFKTDTGHENKFAHHPFNAGIT